MRKEKFGLVLILTLSIFILLININHVPSQKAEKIESEKMKVLESFNPSLAKEEVIVVYEKSKKTEEVNKLELLELVRDEKVIGIQKNGKKELFLEQSAPLINATASWSSVINGINLTGRGESICVIDTGVNKSHPDFANKIVAEYCYCSDNCCPSGGVEENNSQDSMGHGTHVSGIIAANGSLKGIAPDAKIVALKVFGNVNSASDSDIIQAIDWCVANSSIYNISVISMSLGGGAYTSYCDSEQAAYASSINAAIQKNISVIVSTGNDNSYTQIASPACITNSTAVGDVYDRNIGGVSWSVCTDSTTATDKIVCHANRNAITDLFAPGALINSTDLTASGYNERGGTSMAAPMVAGAFAILREYYLKEYERVLTPLEIQRIINSTGKMLNDSGKSNLIFSRVDIYSAILKYDNRSPKINLIAPANASINVGINLSFSWNASDVRLKNYTFYLWNSTDLFSQNNTNASGSFELTSYNISEISSGNYKWNVYGCDIQNNCNFSLINNSFSISSLAPNLIFPLNNISNFTSNFSFYCNVSSDKNLKNLTFFLWNSSSLEYSELKNISGLTNSSIFSYNLSREDAYIWNCYFVNNESLGVFSTNRTFRYDATNPEINLVSPTALTAGTIPFYYNVSDAEDILNCSLIINGVIDQTNSTIERNTSQMFTKSMSAGSYSWGVNCTDKSGNAGNSTSWGLTISAQQQNNENNNPGGGGGGGSPTVVVKTDLGKYSSYNKFMYTNEIFNFVVKSESHSIRLIFVNSSYARILINSTPLEAGFNKISFPLQD